MNRGILNSFQSIGVMVGVHRSCLAVFVGQQCVEIFSYPPFLISCFIQNVKEKVVSSPVFEVVVSSGMIVADSPGGWEAFFRVTLSEKPMVVQ